MKLWQNVRITNIGINFNKEGTDYTEIKCRVNKARTIIKFLNGIPVSYTHLDVYKRQILMWS